MLEAVAFDIFPNHCGDSKLRRSINITIKMIDKSVCNAKKYIFVIVDEGIHMLCCALSKASKQGLDKWYDWYTRS